MSSINNSIYLVIIHSPITNYKLGTFLKATHGSGVLLWKKCIIVTQTNACARTYTHTHRQTNRGDMGWYGVRPMTGRKRFQQFLCVPSIIFLSLSLSLSRVLYASNKTTLYQKTFMVATQKMATGSMKARFQESTCMPTSLNHPHTSEWKCILWPNINITLTVNNSWLHMLVSCQSFKPSILSKVDLYRVLISRWLIHCKTRSGRKVKCFPSRDTQT